MTLADSFTGGTGDDQATVVGSTGVATVALGAGTDTLVVTTADLDATADTLSGIEKIDLSGANGLDLTIDGADLTTNAITTVTGSTASGAVELLKISGTASADTIDASSITTTTNSAVQFTSLAGKDTLTLTGGTDIVIIQNTELSNANLITLKSYTAGTDSIQIDQTVTNAGSGDITDGIVTGEYQTAQPLLLTPPPLIRLR